MAEVKVSLDQFEGPLGLLLYLIRKEEMDIFDINIFQITNEYLAYVKNMKSLDLEGAGDFIAMAATLIQIKSKMLLPKEVGEDLDEEIEDPRKELVQKLLEYQKYQKASKELYERPLLGRDTWTKGFKSKKLKRPDDVVKVDDDNPLYALIVHYKLALKKATKVVHKVGSKIQSIASRVLEIKTKMFQGQKTKLSTLIEVPSDFTAEGKSKILITFLSLLELAKMNYVSIFQSQNYADIHVDIKKDLSGDIVSQVEDYESLDNQDDLFTQVDQGEIEVNLDGVEDDELEEKPAAHLDLSESINENLNEDLSLGSDDVASDSDIEEAEKDLNLSDLDFSDVEAVSEISEEEPSSIKEITVKGDEENTDSTNEESVDENELNLKAEASSKENSDGGGSDDEGKDLITKTDLEKDFTI